MKTKYSVGAKAPDFWEIVEIFTSTVTLELSGQARETIQRANTFLYEKISSNDAVVYGVNTGFGALCQIRIPDEDLSALQYKLIQSHACGMGNRVAPELVKMMLLLKIISLAQGYSGVSLQTVQRLIDFYNHDVLPIVYEQGSLGASGDLAPLAHLSLPLIGQGEVLYKNEIRPSIEVMQLMGWQAVELGPKEGLALLNGTQFMNAFLVLLCQKAYKLLTWSEAIASISLDAFLCKADPFHPSLHHIRHHEGQTKVASHIRQWLNGSELQQQEKKQVQDPYSFRCIPQVLGACRQVLNHAAEVAQNEIAAVTDNPTIFPDEDIILSGGNFHGQPLAFALDYLCLALSEIGSISERRIYKLVSGKRELPPFLVAKPGLNSGLMIVQYLAASVVSQNKQLCTPASVDSIESSAGQEDHVSMGANAATKAWRVFENLEKILSAELLTATQALEFRRPLKTTAVLEELIAAYRKEVSPVEEDRIFHDDLIRGVQFIRNYSLVLP